jgi:hypothetical protein
LEGIGDDSSIAYAMFPIVEAYNEIKSNYQLPATRLLRMPYFGRTALPRFSAN